MVALERKPTTVVLESPPPVQAKPDPKSPDLPSEEFSGPPPTDFVSEELPPDFWDDEPAPYDDATSQPARPAPPPAALDKEAPLFDQLKQLFPGRVVRIDPLETTQEDGGAEALDGEVSEEGAEDIVQDSLFD